MEIGVKTYLFQRKMLGILCGLLPLTCLLFGFMGAENNLPGWYKSISATYYASSKICMIGLLFSASIFFLCYKGYDWRDRTLSLIQAISSMGVIVFPCDTPMAPTSVGLFNLPIATSNIIHCASAAILFIAFGINIFFLFTIGNSNSPEKKKRNFIYHVCGGIIFAFCILQAVSTTPLFGWVPDWFPLTWLNEFFMLEAFAVAWLVKAESISSLNDKHPQTGI